MNNDMQSILESAQSLLENAQQQTASGPAGTRVLHAFVSLLARQTLEPQQREQVETLLTLHEECIKLNGTRKS